MQKKPAKPATIDEYIRGFTPEIQALLEQVRAAIRRAAPEAVEVISYGMPAFKQHGYLIFFAGCKAHIGVYGNTTAALAAYRDELAEFVGAKGSLKFPYKRPIPLDLISRIVELRVQEDREHAASARQRG